MNFISQVEKEDLENDELVTYRLGISGETTAIDVIPVVLKIFDEKEEAKYFWLGEGEEGESLMISNTFR